MNGMEIEAPISLGELLDKISILAIKLSKIDDTSKLQNIRYEHDLLGNRLTAATRELPDGEINKYFDMMKEINLKIWNIEDDIRECERNKDFGPSFIQLARSVYITNDERSRIKKLVNEQFGSAIVEEKSYSEYQ